eukprot:gene16391-22593_t
MSLLLAFKLNRAYDRWKAARRAFGRCGTRSTFLFTQAVAYIEDPILLGAYRRFLSVFTFAVMQTVLAEPELDPKAAAMLLPRELDLYKKSPKGMQVIITKLQLLSTAAQLPTAQMLVMEATVAELWLNAQTASTYGVHEFIRVPATGIITLLLLAVDEVATQLEQPFPMLPLAFLANSSMTDICRVEQEAAELRDMAAAEDAEDIICPSLGHVKLSVEQSSYDLAFLANSAMTEIARLEQKAAELRDSAAAEDAEDISCPSSGHVKLSVEQ